MTQTQKSDTINIDKLAGALEPVIRRVVREELTRLLKKKKVGIFNLTPDMPLYEDMVKISQRKAQGKIKLHSHDEVWSE